MAATCIEPGRQRRVGVALADAPRRCWFRSATLPTKRHPAQGFSGARCRWLRCNEQWRRCTGGLPFGSGRTASAATPSARWPNALLLLTHAGDELSAAAGSDGVSSRYNSRVPPHCGQQRGEAGSIGLVSTSGRIATTLATSGKRRHTPNRASRWALTSRP